jgi:aspartate aminotransferase
MAAKAKQLKASGKTVYDFSLGEPDFTTPDHICAAATQAMRDGHTHYTVASGIPELREAVARQFARRHGVEYTAAQVVVSNGAKHSLHNVFTTLIDPGDEVIIPAPYWVSYAELVQLAEGVPVIVETRESDNWKLSAAALRGALTGRSKMLVLCSPSNPTGSMYSRQELAALADVCIERDLLVLADEIYEQLVYGDSFTSFVAVRPGLAQRTIVVSGVSKTYAMTGWRIGWTLSPADAAQGMASLQSQETSNPSSISQYAALAAISGPQDCVDQMRDAFARRRQFVRQRIADIPGLSTSEMNGAFYAFINIAAVLGRSYGGKRIDTSTDWCLALLEQQQVATVMGSAFGTEGYARLSYAASMDNLEAGFDRLEAFVKGST